MIALNRVLLKNSPIVILDEAASALDNLCERHVQQSLYAADENRTTIFIAHRLTTLKGCDTIYVFDSGRIVEQGSCDELVYQDGVFARLVHSAEHGELV